ASGARYVLKFANREEALEILNMQNRTMDYLAGRQTGLAWPHVMQSRAGNRIVPVGSEDAYFARLLTWVEGGCLAYVQPRGSALLASLGQALARVDSALAGFSHPAAHRVMHWDLRQASMARRHLGLLEESRQRMLAPIFEAWEAIDWSAL